MLARGEKEINQLLFKFVCCRFAFRFSGPPLFCSKPDPRSVRVFASEDERYYTTPPTQPKPNPISVRVFASEDERYYPTPPQPTQPKPDPRSVRVFASEDERYYSTPPRPTPPKMNVITPPHPRNSCACARETKNA